MEKHYLFPWRAKNRFTLLVDAQQFFPAMLAAIEHAQHFILFEQYLVKSGAVLDQFIEHLIQARQRGVQIYVLLDDYGCREVNHVDNQRLVEAGVNLVLYNPLSWRSLYRSLRRDHRKVLIADNTVAFVGGAGISDAYTQGDPLKLNWHDVMLQIEGENVEDWIQAFMQVWQQSTQTLPVIADYSRVSVGDQTGRVHLSRGLLRNDIVRSVISHNHESSHRIWLSAPSFVTIRILRRALRRAARKQIDVRLLLPGSISDHPWISHAGRRYYYKLLSAGVKIYEYQPRFVHSKVILCDDWVSIGSSNLDRWNQRWNLDANQAVLDVHFSQQVASMFEQDFAQSRLITHEDWERRPWWQRLKERYFGIYVSLLHWFNYAITRINKNKS